MSRIVCQFSCGARLTADERHHYENQCERCVGIDMERLGDA